MTGEFAYYWRPSTFMLHVVHATIDGQTPHRSEDRGLCVWALCGQKVFPDREEQEGDTRCQECLSWLRGHIPEHPEMPQPTERPFS